MASPANSQKVKKNILLEDKIDIIKKKETNTKLSDEKLAAEDIRYVYDIIRRLDESVEMSRRQTLLTEYITQ